MLLELNKHHLLKINLTKLIENKKDKKFVCMTGTESYYFVKMNVDVVIRFFSLFKWQLR